MDYTVHGIPQARILEWQPFLSPGDLPNPGIEHRFRGTEDIMKKTNICLVGTSEGTEGIIEIIKERQHLERCEKNISCIFKSRITMNPKQDK